MMNKVWTDNGWQDYLFWQENDKKILKKINQIIQSIDRNGYNCIGKPEALKGDLSGYYSCRINKEHRIIFLIEDENIIIFACRHHYEM